MSNERFELRPGALVVGPDGALGWLDAVLAIPGSGQVSGFVLSEGLLFGRGIRVPIEAVERTEDSRVHVWLSAAQLNHLADMQAGGLAESSAPNEQPNEQPDEHAIKARQQVVHGDGEAGSLALVIVDPTSDRATHLVIRPSDLLGREVMVPMTWVRELTDDPIVLVASRQRLTSLPEYRADEEITDAVSSLLWYRSDIRRPDLRHVKVRTRDGIVELSGLTGTDRSRMTIEGLVRDVRGVLGVRNELKTFEALGAAAHAVRQRGPATDGHLRERPEAVLLPWSGVGSEQDAHVQLDRADSGSVPAPDVVKPLETAA
jgi:hypothetical protein